MSFDVSLPRRRLVELIQRRRIIARFRSGGGKGFWHDGRLRGRVVCRPGSLEPSPNFSALGLRVVVMPQGYVALAGAYNYGPDFRAHPSKVRVFVTAFQNSVAVIEPYHERLLSFPDCRTGTFAGISGDGSRVFLNCVQTSSGSLVAEVESGGVVGFLPTRFLPDHAVLNETGTEILGVEPETIPATGTFVIRRLNVASGAELARTTFAAQDGTVFFDRRTGRAFLVTFDEVLAFDAATLNLVGRVSLPFGVGYARKMVFDPNRPTAYILRPRDFGMYLGILDTETLALGLHAPLPWGANTRSMAIAPEPPAPVNLTAHVSGNQVTLSWNEGPRSPVTTAFEITAGTQSGQESLARIRTADASSTLVVHDVPLGYYYVRVRAVNYSGAGPPSNEVLVTVSSAASENPRQLRARIAR